MVWALGLLRRVSGRFWPFVCAHTVPPPLSPSLCNLCFAGRNDSALLIALLHRLPASNSLVLQRLFEVMALTLACPSSRMTCDSLTKVVGPNLLPKDDVA